MKEQSATPKLAGLAYAFEALEIGAYELLASAAGLAGDARTGKLAERILSEERAAREQIAGTWEPPPTPRSPSAWHLELTV